MKPVIIIAIAVVCSVVAMMGVLIGYEMYQAYQLEKALAFGVDVEQKYQIHVNDIGGCVPHNVDCYKKIIKSFDYDFNTLSQKYGLNSNDSNMREYLQMTHNFFKIEYDYQNEIYAINQEYYDTNSYYDSYYSNENPLVNYWDNAYREAVAQTQIEVGGKAQNSESILSSNSGEALSACSDAENLILCLSKYNSDVGHYSPKSKEPSYQYSAPKQSKVEEPSHPYSIYGGDRLSVCLEFDPSKKTILYEKSRETDSAEGTDRCPDCKETYPEIFNSKICKLHPDGENCQQGWIKITLWFGEYILESNGNSTPIVISENGSTSSLLKPHQP